MQQSRVPVLKLLGRNELDSPAGLDLLSYIVSAPTFVHDRIARGFSFTMGGPPGALAAFGVVGGLVAYAVTALAYSATAALTLTLLRGRALIATTVVGPLVLYVLVGAATQMGFWDAMYGTVALGAYVVTVVGLTLIRVDRGSVVPTSSDPDQAVNADRLE